MRHKHRRCGAVVAAALLSACSLTLPVRGRVGDSTIVGEATGYMDGSGKLHLVAEDGRDCAGAFQYADGRRSGTGTFTCQDGTAGTFAFNSTGQQGTGFGRTTKGERIRFAFGGASTLDLQE